MQDRGSAVATAEAPRPAARPSQTVGPDELAQRLGIERNDLRNPDVRLTLQSHGFQHVPFQHFGGEWFRRDLEAICKDPARLSALRQSITAIYA